MAAKKPPLDPADLEGAVPSDSSEPVAGSVRPNWAYDSCDEPLEASGASVDGATEDR